jgi:Ca2+-binding RTX toxin-like protein
MEKWGMFWTSVAGVSDTAFNPSLGNARIGNEAKARVGVQFTSAPAGGGPDFVDIKSDGTLTAKGKAAAASSARSAAGIPADIGRQIDTLNFNRGPLGIDPGGRHRVRSGTRKSERLRGGGGDDTLQGFRGRDRLYGRGGDDSMLGGKGKDVLLAGPGTDYLNGGGGNDRLVAPRGTNTLIGGGGRDSLSGGRGSDTLVDWDGRTIVRTGRTKRRQRDFVNVRDGDGDDVVICRSKRSTVIVDRRDRVRGRCGKVIRRGRIFRAKKR